MSGLELISYYVVKPVVVLNDIPIIAAYVVSGLYSESGGSHNQTMNLNLVFQFFL